MNWKSKGIIVGLSVAMLAALLPSGFAVAQSGVRGARASGREFGVNLTFALYLYGRSRSSELAETTRLSATYSRSEEEVAHLKEKYGIDDVEVRHSRSVGLREGETFNDAVLLGSEFLTFVITPARVARGYLRLDIRVSHGDRLILEVRGTDFGNFETVIFRGRQSVPGEKRFIGAGGRQDSVSVEKTPLVSVTPEVVPSTSLRNRLEDISRAMDEGGNVLELGPDDRFTPPVPIARVVPRFETGRRIDGAVQLTGVVTPEGRITNVRVLRSIDPPVDDRAIEAFRQYKFSPGLVNGKPVYAAYTEELTFEPPRPSLSEIQEELELQRRKEKEKEKEEKEKKRKPN